MADVRGINDLSHRKQIAIFRTLDFLLDSAKERHEEVADIFQALDRINERLERIERALALRCAG